MISFDWISCWGIEFFSLQQGLIGFSLNACGRLIKLNVYVFNGFVEISILMNSSERDLKHM